MPPRKKTNQSVMQEALRKHGAETRVIQTQSKSIINQNEPNTSQRLSTQQMEPRTTWSDKLYEGARPKKIMKQVHQNNDYSEDDIVKPKTTDLLKKQLIQTLPLMTI
jgi:tRNA G18 (ribose-2'-O)-methylase SpoU